MDQRELDGLLAAAHLRIAGACDLLAQPRSCSAGQCITLFREAQGYLEWARDRLPAVQPLNPDLRRQATGLSSELRRAEILLERAEQYGRAWLERSCAPEYTTSGIRFALPFRSRISFTG